MRAVADDPFRDYLLARGKKRWCDKSLDTFQFADILAQVYPDAKFIVLTRHCMDVIASGVEICPWGRACRSVHLGEQRNQALGPASLREPDLMPALLRLHQTGSGQSLTVMGERIRRKAREFDKL
jgi:hypothetical protein